MKSDNSISHSNVYRALPWRIIQTEVYVRGVEEEIWTMWLEHDQPELPFQDTDSESHTSDC